jgi:hypothetical protein
MMCEIDLEESLVVRALFDWRALILGAKPDAPVRPRGLVARMKSFGWGLLAEAPGREVVFGAVTQPWLANPFFRALPPEEFAKFAEPGFVKIAWTLGAYPDSPFTSIARTETRAAATDRSARKLFRPYWSLVSPGVVAIRWALLRMAKTAAERRRNSAAAAAAPEQAAADFEEIAIAH